MSSRSLSCSFSCWKSVRIAFRKWSAVNVQPSQSRRVRFGLNGEFGEFKPAFKNKEVSGYRYRQPF